MNCVYRVTIIESERGWGQRVDEERDFKSKAEADAFVKEHNAKSIKPGPVPDVYWKACPPVLVDLDAASKADAEERMRNGT